MRLVADLCIPRDLVVALRHIGLTVEWASELGFDRAPDEEIFKYAQKRRAVLLSFDRDFGNMVRFDVSRSAGIVLVEVEGLSKTFILNRACEFFRRSEERALRGGLFLLEPGRTRIWRKRRS